VFWVSCLIYRKRPKNSSKGTVHVPDNMYWSLISFIWIYICISIAGQKSSEIRTRYTKMFLNKKCSSITKGVDHMHLRQIWIYLVHHMLMHLHLLTYCCMICSIQHPMHSTFWLYANCLFSLFAFRSKTGRKQREKSGDRLHKIIFSWKFYRSNEPRQFIIILHFPLNQTCP
jgi:hypothetical protein